MITFYNTLTRKKEAFKPLKQGIVTVYNCGPTVYDYAHIGNFRSYVFADTLRRWLEFSGFHVKQVMNITDVGHMTIDTEAEGRGEDKMEKAARQECKSPWEIAKFYTKAFLEDSEKMRLLEPTVRPRATEHIKEMIAFVDLLIKKKYAYVVNGSVYFDVNKFKTYGELSNNTIDQLKAGARLEINPEKRNPYDFALWVNDQKHIMKWNSPWSVGYPSWHLECSAMSMKYLGKTIDIHTGGEDNIFPHHECERAQSEAASGKVFVKYWLHARHLLVNGEKMSKSKGNFYTIRDLLEKGWEPLEIRYVLLSAHYRTPLNFTLQSLEGARNSIGRIKDFMKRTSEMKTGKPSGVGSIIKKGMERVKKAMDNDLNTPVALAAFFDTIHELNKITKISVKEKKDVFNFIKDIDKIFTIIPKIKEIKLTKEEKGLIEKREKMRKEKKFEEADKIRNKLKEIGIGLEDTVAGVKIKRIKN